MRKLRFVALLSLPLVAGLAAAEIYRWVDEEGVVHYSDQPHPGAEEVVLQPATVISMPRPARSAAPSAPSAEDTARRYESLAFAAPTAEETLWNIEGVLNVSLDVQPGLRQGHRVRVYFDGEPMEVAGTQFQLEEVYRGAHNLQAEIVDQDGNLMIRSEPIRFYVQQTSILNPQRN